jgi:hypothetical protein
MPIAFRAFSLQSRYDGIKISLKIAVLSSHVISKAGRLSASMEKRV